MCVLWNHRSPSSVFLTHFFFTLVFEISYLTEPGVHKFQRTGWLVSSRDLPSSTPSTLGLQVSAAMPVGVFFFNRGSGNWALDLILTWQVLYWQTYLTGISYLEKMSIELLCHCELPSIFTNCSVLIELEVIVGMAFFLIHPTRPKYIEILVGCVIHISLVTSLLHCLRMIGQSKQTAFSCTAGK